MINTKKLIFMTAVIMSVLCIGATASAITFNCDDGTMTVNGEIVKASGKPVLYGGNVYLPVDDLLRNTGFTLGWDDTTGSVVACKNGVYSYIKANSTVLKTGNRDVVDSPTKIFGGVFYMSLSMYKKMSDENVIVQGEPKIPRDLLEGTYVSDMYRTFGMKIFGNIGVSGGRGMEFLSIPDEQAQRYAAVVNSIANSLPAEVNVFNAVVPTSCEFYAPREYYTDQTGSIRKIYSMLDERVIPVNMVEPLMKHANEKIYFNTDHHWTQRGAYYAYCEFAALRGYKILPLRFFRKMNFSRYVGSLTKYTGSDEGSALIASSPDLLERFIPNAARPGEAFDDMYMAKNCGYITAVNTCDNAYSCFIGGDRPLVKFSTGNNTGRKLCILKESYGNAFATWALENYEEVYIVDPRGFNGFNGSEQKFNMRAFYDLTGFNDLLIINYPATISADDMINSMRNMAW